MFRFNLSANARRLGALSLPVLALFAAGCARHEAHRAEAVRYGSIKDTPASARAAAPAVTRAAQPTAHTQRAIAAPQGAETRPAVVRETQPDVRPEARPSLRATLPAAPPAETPQPAARPPVVPDPAADGRPTAEGRRAALATPPAPPAVTPPPASAAVQPPAPPAAPAGPAPGTPAQVAPGIPAPTVRLPAQAPAVPEPPKSTAVPATPPTATPPAQPAQPAPKATPAEPRITVAPKADVPVTAKVVTPAGEQIVRETIARAQSYLSAGRIENARASLEDAARGGNPELLVALAETYDPLRLRETYPRLARAADPVRAIAIYEVAKSRGAKDLDARIDALRRLPAGRP